MRDGQPSRTAFGAARHRALHQDLDDGVVFRDHLAWPILGVDRQETLAGVGDDPHRALRWFIAARHRCAEDRVHAAVATGVDQVVVLGAGLDTFACRMDHPGVTVFEVDHPATGAWKRERLRAAGIDLPGHVRHVGVDFEHDDLVATLGAAGFDSRRPVVVMWLGVIPYLSRRSVVATLSALGAMSCEVVADYRAPLTSTTDPRARDRVSSLEKRVAAVGEPLTEPVSPGEMRGMLRDAGFSAVDDLDRPAIRSRLLGLPPAGDAGGGHIVIASTTA